MVDVKDIFISALWKKPIPASEAWRSNNGLSTQWIPSYISSLGKYKNKDRIHVWECVCMKTCMLLCAATALHFYKKLAKNNCHSSANVSEKAIFIRLAMTHCFCPTYRGLEVEQRRNIKNILFQVLFLYA